MIYNNNTILMCAPDYFRVSYVINPWMEGNISRTTSERAISQWNALKDNLSKVAQVEFIQPIDGLPDLVFTANAGLVAGNKFILSRFFFKERQGEEEHFKAWFESKGFEIHKLPEDIPFEGAGDALFDRGEPILWAGYGFRTELDAHSIISKIIPEEVLSLRLVDNRFYHLDTCFCPLEGGYLMYFPPAFDEYSNRLIELRIPEDKRIVVEEQDAELFACNTVNIGKNIFLNEVSDKLVDLLVSKGFVATRSGLSEFLKAGGSSKCLTIKLNEESRPSKTSKITLVSQTVIFEGHLIDSGTIGSTLDTIVNSGGSFQVLSFQLGEQRQSTSRAEIKVLAPSKEVLNAILNQLIQIGGTLPETELTNAKLEPVSQNGVAPDNFYSTTIFPTEVLIDGNWHLVQNQRMDGVIRIIKSKGTITPQCTLFRELNKKDLVVVGLQGVRTLHKVQAREARRVQDFSFMGASVSTERRIELLVEQVAWELRRVRDNGGKIVVTAGPVIVHTGGADQLSWLINEGYVSALLGGNAIAVHDLENAMLGTSLGINLNSGIPVQGGHQHYLKVINEVRKHGSIQKLIELNELKAGIMHACITNKVPFSLAGSIRDDGPLPETEVNILNAQNRYAELLEGAEVVLLLASMLHSIGVDNMIPSGVKIVCVDINPAVVNKLTARGPNETLGAVTDVGLFLNMLVERLKRLTRAEQ